MSTNWINLLSGSDVRGIATEGIPGEAIDLTPEIAGKIAIAFAKWVSGKKGIAYSQIRIAIGRDSRISGPSIQKAVTDKITQTGCKVINCEMASTPAMFMTTIMEQYLCHGAVMLTASHLPYNRNGMKFFTITGGLDKADVMEILGTASKLSEEKSSIAGNILVKDLISDYSDTIVNYIRKATGMQQPLTDFNIIVDAGNGAGGFYTEKVLQPLGADTSGSLFLNPDGYFPNHIPNPENSEAMQSICNAVIEHNADLGVIFDTDVDRAAIVDNNGNPINRNRIIALIGAIVLEENPGCTIVTDSITSDGLTAFIENELKGKHFRYKRGYRNVISKAIELNREGTDCPLAIETSGHAALRENYFLDDGAFLIAKILVRMAKSRQKGMLISQLIKNLKNPIESREFRLTITGNNFRKIGSKIINKLNEYAAEVKGWQLVPDNHEGIRVSCDKKSGDGWFILRLSLHDPVLPLNVESNGKRGIVSIIIELQKFLQSFSEIDIKPVNLYLETYFQNKV